MAFKKYLQDMPLRKASSKQCVQHAHICLIKKEYKYICRCLHFFLRVYKNSANSYYSEECNWGLREGKVSF